MEEYRKNVEKSVKAVLKSVHQDMTLSRQATKTIGEALCRLNQDLVAHAKRGTKRKTKTSRVAVLPVDAAFTAVGDVIPGSMRRYAEAMVNLSIFKYNSGLLLYDAKPPTPKDATTTVAGRKGDFIRPAKPVKVLLEFTKAVPVLAHMVNEEGDLDQNAKKLLTLILQLLAANVIERAQEAAKGTGTLNFYSIIKAVDDSMAPNMRKHANMEGARNTMISSASSTRHELDKLAVHKSKK